MPRLQLVPLPPEVTRAPEEAGIPDRQWRHWKVLDERGGEVGRIAEEPRAGKIWGPNGEEIPPVYTAGAIGGESTSRDTLAEAVDALERHLYG